MRFKKGLAPVTSTKSFFLFLCIRNNNKNHFLIDLIYLFDYTA